MAEVRLRYFAAAALIGLLVPVLTAQTFKLKVSAEQANIRRRPDIGSALVRQVPQGTILESGGKEGDWYQVRFKDEDGKPLSGYVHKSLVVRLPTLSPGDAAPAQIEKARKPPDRSPMPPRAAPRPAGPSSPSRRCAIEISGGGVFIAGGDPNRAVQGLAEYYQALFGLPSDGRAGSVRLGTSAGLSVDYWPHPRAGIGVALETIFARNESTLSYRGNATEAGLEIAPKLDSIPVRFHFAFAASPGMVVKAGLEYHFARCRYFYRLSEAGSVTEWTGNARAGGLGFYAGASWERPVLGPVSVFVEVSGRYARISGFKGEATLKYPDGSTAEEEGWLYFYAAKVAPDESVSLMFIRDRPPSGIGVSNVRRARVDFSGAGLRAGLRFRF